MPIGDHADTVVGSVSENGTLIRTTVYSGVLFTEVGETRGLMEKQDMHSIHDCVLYRLLYIQGRICRDTESE